MTPLMISGEHPALKAPPAEERRMDDETLLEDNLSYAARMSYEPAISIPRHKGRQPSVASFEQAQRRTYAQHLEALLGKEPVSAGVVYPQDTPDIFAVYIQREASTALSFREHIFWEPYLPTYRTATSPHSALVASSALSFGEHTEEAEAAFKSMAQESGPREAWCEASEILSALCLEADHAAAAEERIAALMGSWSRDARIVMLDGLIDYRVKLHSAALQRELERMLRSEHRRSSVAAMMALAVCGGWSGERLLAQREELAEDHRAILDVYVRRLRADAGA